MPDTTSPNEELDAVAIIGAPTAGLLYDASWVKRRKETLALLDTKWVRRQTSVDLALPTTLQPIAERSGECLVVLPFTLLPKVPPTLMRFDFEDETGRRLPLPTRYQNALASYAALSFRATELIAGRRGNREFLLPAALRSRLLRIARSEPREAAPIAAEVMNPDVRLHETSDEEAEDLVQAELDLARWCADLCAGGTPSAPRRPSVTLSLDELAASRIDLVEDNQFGWLVDKLVKNSVVLAHCTVPPTRQKVLRLSYDHNVFADRDRTAAITVGFGWRPVPLVFNTPYAAADSFHFEFEAPDGLEVLGALLLQDEDLEFIGPENREPAHERRIDRFAQLEAAQETSNFEPRQGARVHVYKSDASLVDELGAILRLRVRREGFVGEAFWTSAAISALLVALCLCGGAIIKNSTSAPSFLLFFPSLVAALVSRAGGHSLINRMLRNARRLLLVNVCLGVLAAGALVVAETGDDVQLEVGLRLYWLAITAVSVAVSYLLFLTLKLPRRAVEHGRLEGSVDAIVAALRWAARQRARLRTRSFRLELTSDGLTWDEARSLCSRCHLEDCLPLRAVGPSHAEPRGFHVRPTLGSPQRTVVAYSARRSDPAIALTSEGHRHLERTLDMVATALPSGFSVICRWGGGDELRDHGDALSLSDFGQMLREGRVEKNTRYDLHPAPASSGPSG